MINKKKFLQQIKFSKKVRTCMLAFVLISIATLTIAYAALSTTLKISGTAEFQEVSWGFKVEEQTDVDYCIERDWNGRVEGNSIVAGTAQILKKFNGTGGITTKAMIAGSEYDVINTNYIRISDHNTSSTNYTRTADVTSALMFNEFLSPKDGTTNPTGGSSATYTDSQVYYIVVWLSETGTNQTITDAEDRVGFFNGVVKFISAQGSEVTATFTDYTSVPSDNL